MSISSYPTGFPNGVQIRGLPLLNTYGGNIFWVNSATGSNGNKGTRERPFATLNYAMTRVAANHGDIIMVAEKHAETITGVGGLTAAIAGTTVIGLGSGGNRPRFLMDGANTVTFAVSAADFKISNCIFAAGHADIVTCFNVTAKDCTIDQCEFVEHVVNENFVTEIKATSTTDNNADGLTVTNCRALTIDAAAAEFIETNSDVDRLQMVGNFICKDAGTAAKGILCATGKDLTNVRVDSNILISGATSGDMLIDDDTTANSGVVCRNFVGHHDTAAVIIVDCDGVRQFQNFSVGSDTESGVNMPAADTLT